MKKIKIITLLLMFFSFSFTQGSSDVALEEEIQEDGIWSLFIKKIGAEKILAKFPANFKLKHVPISENNKAIEMVGSEQGAEYFFSAYPAFLKVNYLNETLLRLKNDSKIMITNISKSTDKRGKILDIEYIDKNKSENGLGLIYKIRILQTKENIYSFSTIFQENKGEQHDYFISSFVLE